MFLRSLPLDFCRERSSRPTQAATENERFRLTPATPVGKMKTDRVE